MRTSQSGWSHLEWKKKKRQKKLGKVKICIKKNVRLKLNGWKQLLIQWKRYTTKNRNKLTI